MKIKLPFFSSVGETKKSKGLVSNAEFTKQQKITKMMAAGMVFVVLLIGIQINNLASQYRKLYGYEMNDGLNRHPYYLDAYDVIMRFRKLNVVALNFTLNISSRQTLNDERDMTSSMFSSFKEGSDLYEKGKKFESMKTGILSINKYLNAVEGLERGTISPSEFSALGESAAMEWMLFTQDCITDEGSIRDKMQNEVLAFKPLAEESLYTLLIYFAIFLAMVWAVISISWKLLRSQRKSYERIDLLISSIGHDLRSPLQAIENSVSLMGSSANSSDRLKYARVIKGSANTVARLVDDILTVVRHQKPNVKNTEVTLQEWVNEFEATYKTKVAAKDLTWVKSCDVDPLMIVSIDSERLRQCVGNLVDNSVRYTDMGHVELIVTLTPSEIKSKMNLNITVSDSGVGIAEKDKKRVFQPFERAARSEDIKGMGLGLSIVQTIAESFHGQITMVSELGHGSKFSLTFPVDYQAPKEIKAHESIAIPQEKSEQKSPIQPSKESFKAGEILVVDDTKDILDSVESLLLDISFEVDTAPSGIIALQMLEKAKYKIVLTDLQMPGVDGVGVAKRVRELGHNSQLIVMTADSAALQANGDDKYFDFVLSKPFHPEDLLAVIEKAEKGAKARA